MNVRKVTQKIKTDVIIYSQIDRNLENNSKLITKKYDKYK